jgi:hypothetical protein
VAAQQPGVGEAPWPVLEPRSRARSPESEVSISLPLQETAMTLSVADSPRPDRGYSGPVRVGALMVPPLLPPARTSRQHAGNVAVPEDTAHGGSPTGWRRFVRWRAKQAAGS